MIYLTKTLNFSASHRIYNPKLSEEDNHKLFGGCANVNGHGHNFVLEVVVCGKVDASTGYVIDLKELKSIIKEKIIDLVDHKNLNIDVKELHGIIPTSENLVIVFWKLLADKIPNAKLYKIKLSESNTSSVEYYGD